MRLVSVGCVHETMCPVVPIIQNAAMKVGVLTDLLQLGGYVHASVREFICVLRVNHRTWDLPLAHALFPTVAPVATTLKNTPAMKKAPKSSESMTGTPVSRLSCSSGP